MTNYIKNLNNLIQNKENSVSRKYYIFTTG